MHYAFLIMNYNGGDFMPDIVSKTDNFLKAIEKYAAEQRSKIESEAEEFKTKELNKAEEDGLKEAYVLLQKKMLSINTGIARELSKAENASRKSTFAKRQEIEDKVFERAKEKLLEYAGTDKYITKLLESAKTVSEKLTADDVTLYVCERDLKLKNKIISAFGRKCDVQASNEIQIGGIMGISRKVGLLADETLDTKLQNQREWFCENSGLTITA